MNVNISLIFLWSIIYFQLEDLQSYIIIDDNGETIQFNHSL